VIGISDYMVPMEMKKGVVAWFQALSQHLSEGAESPRQDNRFSDLDLYPGLSEYEAGTTAVKSLKL
jgi:hypothetical protein